MTGNGAVQQITYHFILVFCYTTKQELTWPQMTKTVLSFDLNMTAKIVTYARLKILKISYVGNMFCIF